MNTHALAWAWQQGERFDNPRVYLTLLALADHAGSHNECHPSRGRIARMIGVRDKGTVTRHIGTLVDMGLIKRFHDNRENGGQSANIYVLNIGDSMGGGAEQQSPMGGGDSDIGRGRQQRPPQEPEEGTPIEPSRADRTDPAFDPDVNKVWDRYCELFRPERAKLTPSRARAIKRALREVESADDMCVAVDGLHANRQQNPRKDRSIEAIWKTHPNSSGSMADRIEWFISQAPRSSRAKAGLPSADPAIVARHKQTVQRGHIYGDDDPSMVEEARKSEEWLARHGIETVRRESDGYPTFPGGGGA